ncbi:hypothetical protein [Hahella chejuensis]|uniref:hypothetical protein n=1 Tax=Hahella chejuensis TaxID=158327 RepID=UPI00031E23ED|nr:hypothetical protein [Hahella chejuensis]
MIELPVDLSDTNWAKRQVRQQRYYFEETLTEAGNGEWVLLPPGHDGFLVGMEIGVGAQGRVEYTTAPISWIESGAPFARSWPHGDVSATPDDLEITSKATAVRGVNISGQTRFYVSG